MDQDQALEVFKRMAADFVEDYGEDTWLGECRTTNTCPQSIRRGPYLAGLYQGFLSALIVMHAEDCECESDLSCDEDDELDDTDEWDG